MDEAVKALVGDAEAKSMAVEEGWRAHVAYADQFLGTEAEYCRRNGLKPSVFREYKKKYGAPKARVPRAKAFVKVERQEPVPNGPGTQASRRTREALFPDARWTAEFIAALLAAL